MYLLAIFTILSVPALTVQDMTCVDAKIQTVLSKYLVTSDVTSLLVGKTFVDIWRRKHTAELTDCAFTKFTLNSGLLKADLESVDHSGQSTYYYEIWTEHQGEGRMDSEGHYDNKGTSKSYSEDYNIFYVDEFAYGYFSCGAGDGYRRLSIGIVKDKQQDAEALESLEKARVIMEEFKFTIPEEMVQLKRTKCPKKA